MPRAKPTADELAWAAYLETPEEKRLCARWADMTPQAQQTWREIARRNHAAGWRPAGERYAAG